MKKIITFCIVIICCFALMTNALAATTINTKTSESTAYCRVTFLKSSTPGYIKVVGQEMTSEIIVIRDTNEKWLWEGPVTNNAGTNFYLGTNHSEYHIHAKTSTGLGNVSFFNYSNCLLK